MSEITVTQADLAASQDAGTVLVLTGTDAEGRRVMFGGDWRPMADLINAVWHEGEAVAEVEPWQVLATWPR